MIQHRYLIGRKTQSETASLGENTFYSQRNISQNEFGFQLKKMKSLFLLFATTFGNLQQLDLLLKHTTSPFNSMLQKLLLFFDCCPFYHSFSFSSNKFSLANYFYIIDYIKNFKKTLDIYSEEKNEVLDITQKNTLLCEFHILFFLLRVNLSVRKL